MHELEIRERMYKMRVDYLASLPEKEQQLKEVWAIWRASPSESPEVADRLYRIAHNLAGSGAPFGFPEISIFGKEIADLIYTFIAESLPPNEELIDKVGTVMTQLSERIQACLKNGIALPSLPSAMSMIHENSNAKNKLIYIVDDDSEFADRLGVKLQDYGYQVAIFLSGLSFAFALERKRPDVIVMDMFLPEGALAGADVSRHIDTEGMSHIPVIFLSMRSDLESRLAAARTGAIYYFTKPIDMQALHQALEKITKDESLEPYRILLVDDDNFLTDIYSLHLEAAGFRVQVLNDPRQAIDTLYSASTDLIMLDVQMPHINGMELGMVIRQFEDYRYIPIVYLTGEYGIENRVTSLRLGADDFLAKPVAPEYLIEVLRSRIDKARTLKSGELCVQNALKELQHYKNALDQHAAVGIFDTNGKFIEINSRFCEISGYEREELIGQSFRKLKSGEHTRKNFYELWTSIASGNVWHGQLKNIGKQGNYFWTTTTITSILDEFGVPQHYVAILTDISPIKNLEKNLRCSKERLSLALEATHTGLWEWDLRSNTSYYNTGWLLLLGYAEGDEISWSSLIHPEDYSVTINSLLEHLSGNNDYYHTEHRKLNARGGWDWVLESGKILERDSEGDVVRMIGTMQIINERKTMESLKVKLQQQLIQSSKMEAMGHLTAGVAHDFNNILGGLLGYAELSSGMLNREHPKLDKLKRYLEEISVAGHRAAELVAQMLIFGHSSSDQEEGFLPLVHVKPLMKEVVNLLRSTIPATIEINHIIQDDGLTVVVQPVHIHQILLNLGINARDAMSEYGKLDFRQAAMSLDKQNCASCKLDFGGDFVEISVSDNGCGIPAHILPNIFDPFFTTKEVGQGSGMGLSVVHGIVHSLGGHILLDSRVGEGTNMRILLPRAEQHAKVEMTRTETLEHEEDLVLKGVRIMVVDDERTMTTMLHELLETHGAKVMSYTKSIDALQAFKMNPDAVDIVITDETMPELSGMHMGREMLKQRTELPIILCTGYSEHATSLSIPDEGISVFMSKPLNIPKLMKHIKQFTEK